MLDAGHADRTNHGGDALAWHALRLQPVFELPALGERTNQAEPAGILAFHDRFRQALVQRVAMRHDEETAAGRRHGDKLFRRIGGGDAHIIGQLRRKHVLAFIDPGDIARQVGQRAHDGRAHVAGAEQGQVRAWRQARVDQPAPACAVLRQMGAALARKRIGRLAGGAA